MDSESSPSLIETVICRSCGCDISLNACFSGTWLRSVKRKYDEFKEDNGFFIPGFELPVAARVQIENECAALREAISSQQKTIEDLYVELDQERNASSSAANEAMSMILRLQREKAEIQMEARQFKRFTEERMVHDQEELMALEDLLYKREQVIQSLTCEVQSYRHRMMSYGLTESEADGERISQGVLEDGQFDLPMYDYPRLKCNTKGASQVDKGVADIEKYSSPYAQERLKNLEIRISQMEVSSQKDQVEGDSPSAKSTLDKVIVGQSLRKGTHSRRCSADSSSSSNKMGYSFADNANMEKLENDSEAGDDVIDKVYTIDAVHTEATDTKAKIGVYDDCNSAPTESVNRADFDDPDIKKLYMRLHALEADRESMRQTIMSMRTEKAQVMLLREIAQQLCREMTPERRLPVRKASAPGNFSFAAIFKWILSFIFWRKTKQQSKYMFGLSANNIGLLMLLDKGSRGRPLRCLTRVQI